MRKSLVFFLALILVSSPALARWSLNGKRHSQKQFQLVDVETQYYYPPEIEGYEEYTPSPQVVRNYRPQQYQPQASYQPQQHYAQPQYEVASYEPTQQIFQQHREEYSRRMPQQQQPEIAVPQRRAEPQDEPKEESKYMGGKFVANAGIVSDYRYRGITQNGESASFQANLDYVHDSGVKVGVWGSTVEFGDADIETDLYAAYTLSSGKTTGEIGAIYYAYPGADSSLNYDYYEVYGLASYDLDAAVVAASLNYSPEFFGESGQAFYPKLAVSAPLPYDFTADASVGYQLIDDEAAYGVPDYMDWSAGLAYSIDGFTIKGQYVDTNLSKKECAEGCGAQGVLSVTKALN